MKRAVKIVCSIILSSSLMLPVSLYAQTETSLPSDEAWQAIQAGTELPSEKAYANLRADRPTDDVPIGGLAAPVPDVTLPALLAFALAAAGLRKKRKFSR